MKNLKKLSWQIPFLLFLILGTYYTLTQKGNGPSQWQEQGSIGGVTYSISCKGSFQQQKALKAELEKTNDVDAAAYLGTVIAKRALEKGINTVVFDRGGFIYQGKIAALAEAAREAGLEF